MCDTEVVFILPAITNRIAGGYKVIYQNANYLSKQGVKVSILYNANKGKNGKNVPKKLMLLLRKILVKLEPRWFELDKKIIKKSIDNISEEHFDKKSIIVVTSADIALKVKSMKISNKVVYMIQDYEKWILKESELEETYRSGFINITVSKWLEEIVDNISEKKSYYIPNGIDSQIFYEFIKQEKRNKFSIAMLYHNDLRKNTELGLKVLDELKKKYPELTVDLFGSPKRPKNIPDWIRYSEKISPVELNKLYNRNSIFLCTSDYEGFGLTGLESMFSGCCLVSTRCLGVQEYAKHRYNSMLCDIGDKEQLVNTIDLLFNDSNLLEELVRNSKEVIEKFSLKKSEKNFYNVIKKME